MAKLNSYKELIVWQKSILLVKQVYDLTKAFPDEEKFGLTSQMRRCSVSVPSNIAEGWGRKSRGNYLQFLRISRGSLFELETQLILSKELNFVNENQELKNLITEISKMLNAMITKMENA